jgi:CO/xanthine dehydrogenase FAD-binding subunit
MKEPAAFYPVSIEEALACLGDGSAVIAGATSFVPKKTPHRRFAAYDKLVFLDGVKELAGVTPLEKGFRIGAMTHIAELACDARLPQVLREAASLLGSSALRNVATAGGNIMTASPASDVHCALCALDADCELVSSGGRRFVPALEMASAPGRTALKDGELLASIVIKEPFPDYSTFVKVAQKRTNGISKAALAASFWFEDGRVQKARLAYGALAPAIRRAVELEKLLCGRTRREASLVSKEKITEILGGVLEPIDDIRSTAEYRFKVAVNITKDLLTNLDGAKHD